MWNMWIPSGHCPTLASQGSGCFWNLLCTTTRPHICPTPAPHRISHEGLLEPLGPRLTPPPNTTCGVSLSSFRSHFQCHLSERPGSASPQLPPLPTMPAHYSLSQGSCMTLKASITFGRYINLPLSPPLD